MSGDANFGKDNLKKLLENELLINDLEAEKKLTRMDI